MADVVAVEDVSEPALLHERVLQSECDRALAGAREAGEPQGCAFLLEQRFPLGPADVALVPGDVRRADFGVHGDLCMNRNV